MTDAFTLDIQHVIKGYSADGRQLLVLDDINLTIPQGQFVTLLGASGCGKTTLLRLLAGLDGKFFGNLRLGNNALAGPSPERGIVFQEPRLMPWLSVNQNIELALLNTPISPEEKRSRVSRYVELLGLEGFEHALPGQLPAATTQRVAMARALVDRPKLLLLDEPFGALDALARACLQDQLLKLWQSELLTVVLATRDVEEAIYLGDRVVVMTPHPGRVHQILDIPLARPRDRAHPSFSQLRQRALQSPAAAWKSGSPPSELRVVAKQESLMSTAVG